MTMKLYVINECCRGSVYGIGTYVRELTTILKSNHIDVYVINLNSEKTQIGYEEIENIHYIHIPAPLQWSIENSEQWDCYHRNVVFWLKLHIEDKKNLIFHLNNNKKSVFAMELKKAFDCKVILTIHYFDWCFNLFGNYTRFKKVMENDLHDDEIEKLKNIFLKEKETFLNVDHIICLSNNTKQDLLDNFKIHPEKITTIYNGLKDAYSINKKNIVRDKYYIEHNIPIFLFVGRIDEIKGLKYAIQAFRIALEYNPNSLFFIVGDGNFDIYMKDCKDIWTNIVWTGLIDKIRLYELYAMADIGIMPSFHEQCSYVAIEMMMHGLPIIGSTSTGLCEMIENNVTGLHIPVIEYIDRAEIDSLLLAEKMLYLLQHPIEAKQMGQNGRIRYLNNYSSDIFRENMLKMYESCLHGQDNKIKVLIVTGQSNHNWEVSHLAIKQILENSGLFTVDVAISPKTGKIMSNFNPDFASYQLVILDYNGDRWPEEAEKSFLEFAGNGGGVVVYHAANNAFKDWEEYNRIIGFGGWGGRDETAGPYIYQQNGDLVYDEKSSGCAGSHGCRHEFVLHCGNPEHPVTKGLPAVWRHAQDELYDQMRGPGIVKDVLFWGYSDPVTKGSGRDELAMFTVDYGTARIFHTTLGHAGNSLDDNVAMQCTGFQVTLLRGAEWAATGQVTQPVPDDFPIEATVSLRKNYK